MAPPPNMEAFNAPSREVCTVHRERTNTPLQALVTLNDPQFVEAARRLAENAIKTGDTDEVAILDYLAHRVLARSVQRTRTYPRVGDAARVSCALPGESGSSPVTCDRGRIVGGRYPRRAHVGGLDDGRQSDY